jgi:hypothetical protein
MNNPREIKTPFWSQLRHTTQTRKRMTHIHSHVWMSTSIVRPADTTSPYLVPNILTTILTCSLQCTISFINIFTSNLLHTYFLHLNMALRRIQHRNTHYTRKLTNIICILYLNIYLKQNILYLYIGLSPLLTYPSYNTSLKMATKSGQIM